MQIHMQDEPSIDVIGEYDWVVTNYKLYGYEGEGEAVFYKDGRIGIVNLAHCSCYEPGDKNTLNYIYSLDEFYNLPITEFNDTEILQGIKFALSTKQSSGFTLIQDKYQNEYYKVYTHENITYISLFISINQHGKETINTENNYIKHDTNIDIFDSLDELMLKIL